MAIDSLIVRDFRDGDEAAFRSLNEEWITQFFAIEPSDVKALHEPQEYVLSGGGRIFFAELDGEAVGCCGLAPIAPGEFELVKMAVSARAQGKGVGRRLLQHTIDQAFAAGAVRLYLESNRILAPAVHLYETCGFQHMSADRIQPSPYARADVFMEMHAPDRLPDRAADNVSERACNRGADCA